MADGQRPRDPQSTILKLQNLECYPCDAGLVHKLHERCRFLRVLSSCHAPVGSPQASTAQRSLHAACGFAGRHPRSHASGQSNSPCRRQFAAARHGHGVGRPRGGRRCFCRDAHSGTTGSQFGATAGASDDGRQVSHRSHGGRRRCMRLAQRPPRPPAGCQPRSVLRAARMPSRRQSCITNLALHLRLMIGSLSGPNACRHPAPP